MNEHSPPPIGRRVAELRKLRGLTQAGLAARLHRSPSWVTKIERGERRVDSMAVLGDLARALSVPLQQLADGQLADGDPVAESGRLHSDSADLISIRRVLDRPSGTLPGEGVWAPANLERETASRWRAYRTARHNFSATLPGLSGVMSQAQHFARSDLVAIRRRAQAALVILYRLASLELHRRGDLIRSRMAIDRALMEAEQSGDPLLVGAVGQSIVCFLLHTEPSDGVASAAAFIDLLSRDRRMASPSGMIILGALHSYGALAAARAGDVKEARRLTVTAGAAATAVGRDGAPHGVCFGPAYSAINETRLLVELGQLRAAARLGERIALDKVASVNRASFHAAYLATAQSMCGQHDDALATVATGLRIAPEMFHDQAQPGKVARDVVRGILSRRRHVDERLRAIAYRLGIPR